MEFVFNLEMNLVNLLALIRFAFVKCFPRKMQNLLLFLIGLISTSYLSCLHYRSYLSYLHYRAIGVTRVVLMD